MCSHVHNRTCHINHRPVNGCALAHIRAFEFLVRSVGAEAAFARSATSRRANFSLRFDEDSRMTDTPLCCR